MAQHFTWAALDDFKGGLWTVSDWLIPADGAQEMLDCYPQVSGGLRAFYKFHVMSQGGFGANEFCTGMFAWSGHPIRDGTPTENSDLLLMTNNNTDGFYRLYRLDLTLVPEPSAWSLIHTFDTRLPGATSPTWFIPYKTTALGQCVYFSLAAGTDTGIWRFERENGDPPPAGDGALTKVYSGSAGLITTHQNRLLATDGQHKIFWTQPGDEDFAAPNFLEVNPESQLSRIMLVRSYAPNDLLIGTEGSPWTLVQDDLEDPIVRTMQDMKYPGLPQRPADTTEGMAYRARFDGIYVTRQGQDFEFISPQLNPFDTSLHLGDDVSNGSMVAIGNFLVMGNGLVWDMRTKAWFRTSGFGAHTARGAAKHLFADRHIDENVLFAPASPADAGPITVVSQQFLEDGVASRRMETYTWKSAPLRDPEHRQIIIREVHVVARGFNAASTCTVTVNGTARTYPVGAARNRIRFPFLEMAEVLDVTVQPNSNLTDTEAPIVEAVLVATLRGHLTY